MTTASARAPGQADRLARCAFELFAERGFAQVNLDDIAARAGVTKGSLYWHFENKQALVLAACGHYYRQWHRAVQTELAPLVEPRARLRAVLRFSVHSCVIDPRNRLFTTGIFMLMQEDAAVRAGWAQFYDSVRESFVGLVRAARGDRGGAAAERDARRAVDLMLEAMEGLKLRAGFEPHIAAAREQRDLVDDLMGILCPDAIPAST